MKNLLLFCLLFFTSSIAFGQEIEQEEKINSTLNEAYYNSCKSFKGRLSKKEYRYIIDQLEKELKTKITEKTSIIIHYYQKAPNCLANKWNKNDVKFDDYEIRMASKISSKHNAIDFFVYSKGITNGKSLEHRKNVLIDSGFFYNVVFTLHNNCRGFLIIKPNRKFLKHYGEDYYSIIEKFL